MSDGDIGLLIAYAAAPTLLVVALGFKLWELRKARHWPSTEGKVVASGIQAHKKTPGHPGYNFGDTEVSHEPRVEYEYQVGAQKHRGRRINFDAKTSSYELESILARYPVGASVTVFYDPADPQSAVLERHLHGSDFAAIGILLAFFLAVPPLAMFAYSSAVPWIRPHLANPNYAELVTVLMGIGLLVLLSAIGCTGFVWRAGNWPIAHGRVVASRVEAFQYSSGEGGTQTRYKPAVLYTYGVDGRQYSGDRVTYGLVASGYSQRYAKRIADRYPEGTEVDVYYNPKRPSDSLLNPHARWHYFVWLVAAGILGLAWAIATGRVG